MFDKYFFKLLFVSFITVLFYILLTNLKFVFTLSFNIISIISPIIYGLIFSFLINILMVKSEKIFKKRGLSIAVAIAVMTLFVTAFLLLVMPEIIRAAVKLSENLPVYIGEFNKIIKNISEKIKIDFPPLESLPGLKMDGIITKVSGAVSVAAKVLIGFVLSIYILLDKENFIEKSKKLTKKIFKTKSEKLFKLAKVSGIIFTNFIISQLTEAAVLGGLTFVGMLILRLPYAAMISGVVGVTALVPMVGGILGGICGFLIILSEDFIKAVWFIVFLIVLQQIDGNFIYPKIVGKSIGLPPAAVLVSVTLGAGIAGAVGILLSVPAASVIYYYIWEKEEEKLC